MRVDDQGFIPMDVLEQSAAVMRVLAHPHRLRICELLTTEQVSVNGIAEHLRLASNAVSQHLNIMKAHGLLTCERHGKTVYYRVSDPRPMWLLQCIRNHACGTAVAAPLSSKS